MNLPGLPGRPDGTPAVRALVDMGFGVVQPQYLGTYDSEGPFDPRESWRTISVVSELMRNGELSVGGESSRAHVGTVAHSFGTHVITRAILEGVEVGHRLVLFAPMLGFGRNVETSGIRVDLRQHARDIAHLMPYTYRLSDPNILRNFFIDAAGDLPTGIANTTGRVLLVAGSNDASLEASVALKWAAEFFKQNIPNMATRVVEVPGAEHGVDSVLDHGFADSFRRFLQD